MLSISNVEPGCLIDMSLKIFSRFPFSLVRCGGFVGKEPDPHLVCPRERKVHWMHRREWLGLAGNFRLE